MLSADAYFQISSRRTTLSYAEFHKLTNAILVNGLERVIFQDIMLVVVIEKLPCVVP